MTGVQSFAVGHVSQLVARLRERVRSNGEAQPAKAHNPSPAGEARPAPIPVEVHQPNPEPLEIAQRVLAPVLNPLETTLIVLIVSIFIMRRSGVDLRAIAPGPWSGRWTGMRC